MLGRNDLRSCEPNQRCSWWTATGERRQATAIAIPSTLLIEVKSLSKRREPLERRLSLTLPLPYTIILSNHTDVEMRLIDIHTLQMEEFFDKKIPKYIILSHTWGPDEITFQEWQAIQELEDTLILSEIQSGDQAFWRDSYAGQQRKRVDAIKAKGGYKKVIEFCAVVKALNDGESRGFPRYRLLFYILTDPIDWIWIDTCCIDKKSSAELSEAINSMYRWYTTSELCIVYLSDTTVALSNVSAENSLDKDPQQTFLKSRWFTRGWTLQELLAPREVVFLDSEWRLIGTAPKLSGLVKQATGIDPMYVRSINRPFTGTGLSISLRMSWASKRTTTRSEDMAYCLLGIFGVNMPLLYGERGTRAFFRLQEEIMKQSTDHTIFAWGYGMALVGDAIDGEATKSDSPRFDSLLAPSPAYFANGHLLKPVLMEREPPFQMTNKGLQIRLRLRRVKEIPETHITLLNCISADDIAVDRGLSVGIPLRSIHSTAKQGAISDGDVLKRFATSKPTILQVHHSDEYTENTVFLRQSAENLAHYSAPRYFVLVINSLAAPEPSEPWKIHQVASPNPQLDQISLLSSATSPFSLKFSLWNHGIGSTVSPEMGDTKIVVGHFMGPINFLLKIETPKSFFWNQLGWGSSDWRLSCQDLDSSEHKDTWVPIPLVQPGPLSKMIKENRARYQNLSEWPSHEALKSLDSFPYVAVLDITGKPRTPPANSPNPGLLFPYLSQTLLSPTKHNFFSVPVCEV